MSHYKNFENIKPIDLNPKQQFLLKESKTFCMLPWVHLYMNADGSSHPCCLTDFSVAKPLGDCNTTSLEEIWNSEDMRQLRNNMLIGQASESCNKCYEQEANGFVSMRNSSNKYSGHHIGLVDQTTPEGQFDDFKLRYYDIRFSNLCNLRCRSCGHIYSSQWYQDQAKLAGPEWAKTNKPLLLAGKTEFDLVEQMLEHIDYVEQIYFAGGEPLLMEEHYNILEELVKRGRTDVRLIYNTNFTHTDLKGKSVFEYWNKFKQVAVGASLDAMGPRAEYIRKGTDWAVVEQNRRDMQQTCPNVDFYISPTLSIMNAWHLPDFHRDWVEAGLIRAQDLNVNILQDPAHYRIDIAPIKYKQRLRVKYQEHLAWLKQQGDRLGRATQGFESAINFMMATDNSNLIPQFWSKTQELDAIRNESLLAVIPELEALK